MKLSFEEKATIASLGVGLCLIVTVLILVAYLIDRLRLQDVVLFSW